MKKGTLSGGISRLTNVKGPFDVGGGKDPLYISIRFRGEEK